MAVYVDVDLRSEVAETALRDPSDLKSLKVVVHGDPGTLAGAIAPIGRVADEQHVFLAPDALVRMAGPLADDHEWRSDFDAMVAYASSKGWTDDAGAIRAHVEPASR